jgi:hypothetical protein
MYKAPGLNVSFKNRKCLNAFSMHMPGAGLVPLACKDHPINFVNTNDLIFTFNIRPYYCPSQMQINSKNEALINFPFCCISGYLAPYYVIS